MRLGGLSWKFLGGITAVVILALGASFWMFTAEVERLRDRELTGEMLAEGRLLRHGLGEGWAARNAQPIAGMVHALQDEGTDVIVMVTDGSVLVNTLGAPLAEKLLQQPESLQALREGFGESTRSGIHGSAASRTVALRVGSDADELGVVWLARPRWTFVAEAGHFKRAIMAIGVIALALILALDLVLTRRWAGLLRRLRHAAQSLSSGDLSARAEVSGSDEFALLAQSLNEMRRRLLAHTETIDQQRQTLESLLNQLQEGVIAAGGDGRIILINPAARRLLGLPVPDRAGDGFARPSVEQCLPQFELQRMLSTGSRATDQSSPVGEAVGMQNGGGDFGIRAAERELQIDAPTGTVHLLARASELRLPNAGGHDDATATGRLLVLADITALRQALQVQAEFVANASHELRTPLSSIRAAVETLLQMDLGKHDADAGRFVGMIDRHSARLTAMASDLLDLSRLQSATSRVKSEVLELARVLRDLSERFAEAVAAKGLDWQMECSGERRKIVANGRLLQLVLDNLVDNAIQFTERGGHVRLVCQAETQEVAFEVVDDGCGIPAPDLERVFERFYQVERARSGARRGTGLGLAIVRSAVTALGGTVRLESQFGRGTRVRVVIPQPN
jgi:signal transduction histidine kinase